MNRAFDLDTIAPDDPIVSPASPSVSSPVKKTKIKTKKSVKTESVSTATAPKKVHEILSSINGDSHSFLIKPKDFKFQECEDDEEILLVLRPHWFTNFKWVLIALLMVFVPTILTFVFSTGDNIFGADIFPGSYKFIATLFWYLFVFIYSFENFLSWYFDLYIITDRRVIDINFNNLLDVKSSSASIEDIQDITSRITGFGQTLFNYGDVQIQTAGTTNEIIFEKVPNPNRVTEVLQELREEIKNEAGEAQHE